ncbi:hypothetical protein [Bacillus norwichensis]|uniref:Uncharacterized protein n=1 Tax=Bacillus norwichensis TaxID=2762217 RepID=A0ABR8VIJ9_9BACI|nr:hypothetical protein [Bacillus norwichensis]MBD8004548.1 hypothetical protein [Bacillus norwichensis]
MSRKSRYVPLEKRVVHVAEILDIQANEPNTQHDPYMTGIYNGLEMALATMEQREPVLKEAPRSSINQWIKLKLFKIIGLSKNKGLKK